MYKFFKIKENAVWIVIILIDIYYKLDNDGHNNQKNILPSPSKNLEGISFFPSKNSFQKEYSFLSFQNFGTLVTLLFNPSEGSYEQPKGCEQAWEGK